MITGTDRENAWIMRGAGWIRRLREDEAEQLRADIRQLELDLINAANSKARWNLHEIAHALRRQKAHLERLEECLAAMPLTKQANGMEVGGGPKPGA